MSATPEQCGEGGRARVCGGIELVNSRSAFLLAWGLATTPAFGQVLVDNPFLVGDPKIESWVVDVCKDTLTKAAAEQVTCFAKAGVYSGPRNSSSSTAASVPAAACNLTGCLNIMPSPWEKKTVRVEGTDFTLRHRIGYVLSPKGPAAENPAYNIAITLEVDMFHLQKNLPYVVSKYIPASTCEQAFARPQHSDAVSPALYHFRQPIRVDVRKCVDVPCFPEVTETCVSKTDVGRMDNTVNVEFRASVADGNLTVTTNNYLQTGPRPTAVQMVGAFESLVNALTGNAFKLGVAKQIDDQIKNAIADVAKTSSEIIRERIPVPKKNAFKFVVHDATFSFDGSDRALILTVKASAEIPNEAVCEARAALQVANKSLCGTR